MTRQLIRPHPDRIVSVLLTRKSSRHVLRDGPLGGPSAKTLCGRPAEVVEDRAVYCCQHAWRERSPNICYRCNRLLWRSEWQKRRSEEQS